MFLVPRLNGLAADQDPALRSLHQFTGGCDLVNDTELQGLERVDVAAGQHQIQRCLGPGQTRKALRAAGAGQEPDLYFGLADLGRGVVGDDAAMAGEAEFEATAERRSDYGRDNRFAAGFKRAKDPEKRPASAMSVTNSRLVKIRLGGFGKMPSERLQPFEIGTGAK